MTAPTLDLATLPTPYSATATDEPGDGATILVTTRARLQSVSFERVFVRTDNEPGSESGDWWPLGAPSDPTRVVRPWAWGEVLGFDEPAQDRPDVSWERLYSASELEQLAGGAS